MSTPNRFEEVHSSHAGDKTLRRQKKRRGLLGKISRAFRKFIGRLR